MGKLTTSRFTKNLNTNKEFGLLEGLLRKQKIFVTIATSLDMSIVSACRIIVQNKIGMNPKLKRSQSRKFSTGLLNMVGENSFLHSLAATIGVALCARKLLLSNALSLDGGMKKIGVLLERHSQVGILLRYLCLGHAMMLIVTA